MFGKLGLLALCCFICGGLSACTERKPKALDAAFEESPVESAGPYQADGLDRPALTSKEVRDAMSRVPRHDFVPKESEALAYDDRALPIGFAQTISQPYIVGLMTQEAGVSPGAKVLEIGTGSGYQAAVLAEMGSKVFTIEIVPELAENARHALNRLGYQTVNVRQGDGWNGWPEEAPFDAILVTASSPGLPPQLLAQLGERGRMVIPLEGKDKDGETLMVVERSGDDFITSSLGAVKFVPLTGDARNVVHEAPSIEDSALDGLINGIEDTRKLQSSDTSATGSPDKK